MSAMKDSGIPWIGLIPEGWEIYLLSSLSGERKNKNKGGSQNNLLSLSYGKIKRKDIKSNNGLLPASFDSYNIIEPNDIVLRLTDLQNDKRSLRTAICHEKGIITSAYITIKLISWDNPKYMHYLLHSYDISKVFYNLGDGVRQSMNFGDLKRLKILRPPLETQQRIADYLDEKCAKIDEIVAKEGEVIEKLKAYKLSLITETVTKGLDPNAEMKDSGIEYLGQIPSHWETPKLKYSIKWKSIRGHSDKTILSLYRDYGVIPKSSRTDNHNVTSLDTSGYKLVEKGDFVINKMKAWQGSLAVSNYLGIISPAYHICTITNKSIFPNYFHYLMRNVAYLPEYARLSTGMRVGQWDLSYDDFRLLPFLLPPLAEQQAIADYLDEKCAKIEETIAKKQALIEKLGAYKKSLIYEVVTGKKEV